MKSFASDNSSGVHPDIFRALEKANQGHAIAYGEDPFTKEAKKCFQKIFGEKSETYFLFSGTGANVAALNALTRSYQAVICSEMAHIHIDECGASENYSGVKLLTIPGLDGKISPKQIEPFLSFRGIEHHVQPKVISITQPTELGVLYSIEEIKALCAFAKKHQMYLHVDGARLCTAAAALNVSFKELITDAGVDVLSFGGTKNGMMFGDAVVFLDASLAKEFKYVHKQSSQLASKMRFLAVQFTTLLSNDLWLENATKANEMAQYLFEKVKEIPNVQIVQKVQTNAVFVKVPPKMVEQLQKEFFFYVWDQKESIVRWMCSFDTTKEDVDHFVAVLKKWC